MPTNTLPREAAGGPGEAAGCPAGSAAAPADREHMSRAMASGRGGKGGSAQRARGLPPRGAGGTRKRGERPDPMEYAAIDVYAMTNPALCGLVVSAFAAGAQEVDAAGPEFPLLFLPVPIVLSRELLDRFRQTNRATGLFEWLARHPAVTVSFAERMSATVTYSRRGMLFAARYGLAEWRDGGRLSLTEDGQRAVRAATASSGPAPRGAVIADAVRAARRLGAWVAEVRSAATVLHAFGVAVSAPR